MSNIPLSAETLPGLLRILAAVNNAAVDICVQVFLCTYVWFPFSGVDAPEWTGWVLSLFPLSLHSVLMS